MEPMKKSYVVIGDPVPLSRPRFSKYSKAVFDPQKNQKLFAQITLEQQHGKSPLFVGPLKVEIIFYMPAPKMISKKRKEALVGKYHIFKPDVDNLVKYVHDICVPVIMHDDCIIASVTAYKIYDLNPRTEFLITQLPERMY